MPPQPPRRLGANPLTELRKDGVEKGFAWVNNAREDLISANNNYNSGDYAWSAFISFTSAEKGLKAVIFMFEENPEGMLRHPLRDYYERALAHVPELAYISEAVDVFEEYDSFIRKPPKPASKSSPARGASITPPARIVCRPLQFGGFSGECFLFLEFQYLEFCFRNLCQILSGISCFSRCTNRYCYGYTKTC